MWTLVVAALPCVLFPSGRDQIVRFCGFHAEKRGLESDVRSQPNLDKFSQYLQLKDELGLSAPFYSRLTHCVSQR